MHAKAEAAAGFGFVYVCRECGRRGVFYFEVFVFVFFSF